MAARRHIRLLAVLALVLLVAAGVSSGIVGSAGAASSSTVVAAEVPSAISLADDCHSAAATQLGVAQPGSAVSTATGAGVCRFTWSSTNDSSMLRIHQADRTGAAMTGHASSWTNVWGSGAPIDISGAGSTYQGMTTWAAAPMYQSSDSGATFTLVPEPGDYTRVSVASTSVAWRGGPDGLQRSLDANTAAPTWADVPAWAGGCLFNDIDAHSASTAWVLCDSGAYVTTDGGATWNSTAWIANNAYVLEGLDATRAVTIGYGTLRRTIDDNATWTDAMNGIPAGRWMASVSVSPATVDVIWSVDTVGSVYRSTNAAGAWSTTTALPEPLEATAIEALSDTAAIVAGADGLAFITTNSGATWNQLRNPTNGSIREVVALDSNHFLIASNSGATYATGDGGVTWVDATDARDNALDTDVVDAQVIVTADGFGRVQRSSDGGSSWTPLQTGIEPYAVRGVAIHGSGEPAGEDVIFAVGDAGRIAVSRDGGSSWQQPVSGTSADLWDIDVRADGVALAVGSAGTILRSTDWGASWTSVGAATSSLRAVNLRAGGLAITVGAGGLIRRSTDSGATWSTPASGTTGDLQDLAVPSDDVAYATAYEELLKSTDGGATWTAVTTMAGDGVWGSSRIAAPTADTIWLFQAFDGGWTGSWAARSRDGGATWELPFAGNAPHVSSPLALDTGAILMPGLGGFTRVTDPAPDITDYAPGSWAGGTARFGFCLQQLGGAAGIASFAEDADNDCQLLDTSQWHAVPTTPTKLGQVAAAGSGSADLVFGLRADNTVTPGEYSAGIVVTALAPDA